VSPSPSKERGRDIKREASPLLDSLYSHRGFKRGASPSFQNPPLPLAKGKGIQGMRLQNYLQIMLDEHLIMK